MHEERDSKKSGHTSRSFVISLRKSAIIVSCVFLGGVSSSSDEISMTSASAGGEATLSRCWGFRARGGCSGDDEGPKNDFFDDDARGDIFSRVCLLRVRGSVPRVAGIWRWTR